MASPSAFGTRALFSLRCVASAAARRGAPRAAAATVQLTPRGLRPMSLLVQRPTVEARGAALGGRSGGGGGCCGGAREWRQRRVRALSAAADPARAKMSEEERQQYALRQAVLSAPGSGKGDQQGAMIDVKLDDARARRSLEASLKAVQASIIGGVVVLVGKAGVVIYSGGLSEVMLMLVVVLLVLQLLVLTFSFALRRLTPCWPRRCTRRATF